MYKALMMMLVSITLFMGCDSERNPASSGEGPQITVTKSTVVVHTKNNLPKNVVLDTIHNLKNSSELIGSIVLRDTKAPIGAVVCSDRMNRCAKTNSAGIYRLEAPAIAGRRASGGVDTVLTPENVGLSLSRDTVIDTVRGGISTVLDTTHVLDSIRTSESTIQVIDSIIISESISNTDSIIVKIDSIMPEKVTDTLTVVNSGTVMGEIYINSWGFILPVNYIVQRSIIVLDSTWDHSISKVEAVYFIRGDSLAKVIPLGNIGRNFSGFMYTLYNDQSFKNDDKIYNLFIRGRNDSGVVIAKTDIRTFSERFGDMPSQYLAKKVNTPEYKITPAFVPAAKNNEVLSVSAENFLKTSDSLDWMNLDAVNILNCTMYTEMTTPSCKEYALDVDGVSFGTRYEFERTVDSACVEYSTLADTIQVLFKGNEPQYLAKNTASQCFKVNNSSFSIGAKVNTSIVKFEIKSVRIKY